MTSTMPSRDGTPAIVREGRKYSLQDLDSTNGTRLNGELIVRGKKVPLSSGDVIELGDGLALIFVTAEAHARRNARNRKPPGSSPSAPAAKGLEHLPATPVLVQPPPADAGGSQPAVTLDAIGSIAD